MARRAGLIFRHFVFMMIGALLAVPYFAVFIWATQLAAVSAGLRRSLSRSFSSSWPSPRCCP